MSKTIGDYWQYLTSQEKQLLVYALRSKHALLDVPTLPFIPFNEVYPMKRNFSGSMAWVYLRTKLHAMHKDDLETLERLKTAVVHP